MMLQIVSKLTFFLAINACTEQNALQPGQENNLREGGINKEQKLLEQAEKTNSFPTESKDIVTIEQEDLSTGSIQTRHIEINFDQDSIALAKNETLAVVSGEVTSEPEDLNKAFNELYSSLNLTNTLTFKGGIALTAITENGPIALSKQAEVCKSITLDENEQAQVVFLNLDSEYSLVKSSDIRIDANKGVCNLADSLNGVFFYLGFVGSQNDSSSDSDSSSDNDSNSASDSTTTGSASDRDSSDNTTTGSATDNDSSSSSDSTTSGDVTDNSSDSDSTSASSTGGSIDVADTTPPTGVSLTINSDAAATNNSSLDLGFGATDATQMAFGVASDCSSLTEFAPYKTSETGYTVDMGSDLTGTISISVIYQDDAGNKSACVTKSIEYDKEPPTSGSLQINNGDAATNATSLELTLAATGATQMAYGLSPDCSVIGGWVDFETSVTGVGSFASNYDAEVSVSVIFRDALGNETSCFSDSIQVDRAAPTGASLTIEDGAIATSNTTLSLATPATGASEMAFAEAADCSSLSGWIAHSSSHNLALGSTPSDETTVSISMQTRDAFGHLGDCVTDSIVYDSKIGDQIDDDNTATGFAGGTHNGTEWDGSKLTIIDNQIPATRNLASTWTPQWNQLGAYYPLDGDTNDHSGNGHHATLKAGAALNNSTVKVGSHSASLNGGSSQFIEVLHHADLKPTNLTVSIWANLDNWGTGTSQSLISNHQGGGYAIYSTGGRHMHTWVYAPISTQTNSECDADMNGMSDIVDGQWAHFALTYDGTTQNCYINGVLVATVENPGSSYKDAVPHASNATVIGAEADGASASANYLTGKVDDVAVWKTALTADEIALIYNVQAEKYHKNLSTLDSSWTPLYDEISFYISFDGDYSVLSPNSNYDVNNLTATNNGSVLSSSHAKVGSHSADFQYSSGESDHIAFGTEQLLTNANPFTISTWAKLDSFATAANNWPIIMQLATDQTSGVEFGFSDSETGDGLKGIFFGGGSDWDYVKIDKSDPTELEGQWQHVVVSYNGSGSTNSNNFKMYLNGVKQTLAAPTGGPSKPNANLIGGLASNSYWDGQIDEIAIWSQHQLSDEQVKIIYDRQKAHFSASYTSRVMDTGKTGSSWDSIEWESTLPYGKELSTTMESTDDYSSSALSGLAGPIRIYHFNETTADSVGGSDFKEEVSGYHLDETGGIAFDKSGILSRSFGGDGVDAYLTAVNTGLPDGNSPRSASVWVKFQSFPTTATVFQWGNPATSQAYGLNIETSGTAINNFGWGNDAVASYSFDTGKWIFLVTTFDGTNAKIYVNGLLIRSEDKSSWNTVNSVNLYVGSVFHGSGIWHPFPGLMDELAIWDRTLSDTEVVQLYQRGANRTKFQVRTCTAADCSDNPTWKGPDNTASSYFSELFNRTNNDSSLGVLNTLPAMTFDNFSGSGLTVPTSRFFQYRVILESDDVSSSPDVESLTVGPTP